MEFLESKPNMVVTQNPGIVIHIKNLVDFQRATERQKALSHYSGEMTSSYDTESIKSSNIDILSILSQVLEISPLVIDQKANSDLKSP